MLPCESDQISQNKRALSATLWSRNISADNTSALLCAKWTLQFEYLCTVAAARQWLRHKPLRSCSLTQYAPGCLRWFTKLTRSLTAFSDLLMLTQPVLFFCLLAGIRRLSEACFSLRVAAKYECGILFFSKKYWIIFSRIFEHCQCCSLQRPHGGNAWKKAEFALRTLCVYHQ